MAEAPTGNPKPPESQPSADLEILDFQKYGVLYYRFFIAGIIGKTDASGATRIINPDTALQHDLTSIASLDQTERNYNPVLERFSFSERDEQWKGFSFENAYSQWRAQFTNAIKNIKDEKRIAAFQTILPGKNPEDFTSDDADDIFEYFSQGKSDVTEFVGVIKRKLSENDKIDSNYLKLLVPHFEWLGSGLFGRQTAVAATRLIELESELHNNFNSVISAFSSNIDRINTPQDHEKRLLDVLHAANIALIQQPKVAPEELEEDDDEEELVPPPLNPDASAAPPTSEKLTKEV